MLLTNPIIRGIVTGIIAPHGITDLVHAKKYQLLPELYGINICSVLATIGLDYSHSDALLNFIFFSTAIFHFRNDMPKLEFANQSITSTMMILSFFTINPKLFLFYMIFIHVPNHYLMNWELLKENKEKSIMLLSITTLISMIIGDTPIIENHIIEVIAKGLIISHIIYEEAYIFKTLPVKRDYEEL